MALKIPDAPNIVGGDEVLRSPSVISPVTNTPNFSVDFSGLQKDVGDAAQYYKSMVHDQTVTYMTGLKNDYLQHMTSYQNDVFQRHQGNQAVDLYAQFIKKESDNWLADRYGEPKDDGKVRIADAELQKQFSAWVESQQPHFINNSANYEEREWDKYRESAFKARDTSLAQMIVNADGPVSIQNAIQGFIENSYAQNPGLDKDYINQAAAAKIDSSIQSRLITIAGENPESAFRELTTYEPVVQYLKADSKEKVLETVRKSYKNIAIDELAKYKAGTGGSYGMVLNENLIAQIYGSSEVPEVVAEIESKAEERKTAIQKQQQGQKDRMMNVAMDGVVNARTDEDFEQALMNVYNVDNEAAISMLNAKNTNMAHEVDMQTLGIDAKEYIDDVDSKYLLHQNATEKLIQQGISEDDAKKSVEILQKAGKLPKSEKTKEQIAQEVIQDIVDEKGEWNRAKAEAAVRVWQQANDMKSQMNTYKELSARISSGEIQSYNNALMGNLDWAIQKQLIQQIRVNNDYLNTKRALGEVGVSLDSVAKNADEQYAKLDISSQNLLKRNFVYEVNNYKNQHGGTLPDEEACAGIMSRVQKNSMSPEMKIAQDVALQQNLAAGTLTDEQRYDLATAEKWKWEYNKPEKRGLSDQQKRAESYIDKLVSSDRLSAAERQYIKVNKAYFIPLVQSGDLTTIANFIGLAKQGGF